MSRGQCTPTGGALWAAGLTTLGYFLGQIAFVRNHIELILIGIVAVSVVPIAVELLRACGRTRSLHDPSH